MAHQSLALAIEFRERAAEWRVVEDGVVAEAVRAARLGRDLSLDRGDFLVQVGLAVGEGHTAVIACRAAGDAALAQRFRNLAELRRIVGAEVAGRVSARGL